MPTKTLYNNRVLPFTTLISSALGDDFNIRFTLRDENGANITTGTPTSFLLTIKYAPDENEDLADMVTVASIAQAAMTISLPNVDVPVKVTATPVDWSSQVKGLYYAKLTGKIDTRNVTPSEFKIIITD